MELEDMKQIWCAQDDQPLYNFDEEALHQNIKSKKERANRLNNKNDFGLIAICIITAIIYSFLNIITGTPNIYNYLVLAAMLLYSGLTWMGRVRRKKKEQTFDRTMLGDLDHAISSVTYEMNRSKNMVWWFILPAMILTFLNMSQVDASWWNWVVQISALVLSTLLLRWDYSRCQKQKKQKLKALRDKLTEEAEAEIA